ncbi:organic solute transporter Ostalpha-domain-containing protein [Lasiosphaeris hirsuta]|uniref:Organic solute transporter Ostalpha-domain-containing protein n=1 Tax=Lasiosphaeris hirsuta TaxID=260670 RepID=A0AA40DX25_9PEZI|nr:organic solute transporter Ostalpha-domain-containing protein [Lasiosphaeris hirsuta]
MNLTCNSTLEDLRILPATEIAIAGPLTFHQLALVIAAASTLVAILLSSYLIMMHATHYTVPHEQRHIIRILFMIPVYATSSFLSLRFYWHAIYFQVLSDCYEAFAISSFFSLMCHYIAPDLHEQKEYFREMHPVKPWVWPLNWFAKCCGGERGPWRTPRSGLTWFNIVWIGIYHYCFIRVAMTITAVATQYFHRYCESSNSPLFGHIWIVVVQSIAVTIAMYCVIQFYVQLRATPQLEPNQPFLKVLAIKLVIFLSFWQSTAISVGTSTLDIVHANEVLAYPDIKVGIPSLLLCFEMACFAVLHLWAFPYASYRTSTQPKKGGPLGLLALWDATNVWDVVKGFGRGMRWLFVGARHRRKDQFRASRWYDRRHEFRQQLGLTPPSSRGNLRAESRETLRSPLRDETAGLIFNAQPNPGLRSPSPYGQAYGGEQTRPVTAESDGFVEYGYAHGQPVRYGDGGFGTPNFVPGTPVPLEFRNRGSGSTLVGGTEFGAVPSPRGDEGGLPYPEDAHGMGGGMPYPDDRDLRRHHSFSTISEEPETEDGRPVGGGRPVSGESGNTQNYATYPQPHSQVPMAHPGTRRNLT